MTIWIVVLSTPHPRPHFSFLSLSPPLFSLCLSFSVCLCLSIFLSASVPVCLSVCLVFSIRFLFFVVVVVFLSLMLSRPFPSSLCKLPKYFAYYFFNFSLYFFAPAVCHCYPSHFRCSHCLFLYVLLLLLLLLLFLWMLCLFISFYDCILPWMSWWLVVL